MIFGRVEIDKEVVDFVEDLFGAGVLAVDLVDGDDDFQVGFQRLLQHEAGLRQGAFGGVDEQDSAVDHHQGAFDFTAEIGVAGGVEDVDLNAFPINRAVFGGDGDAAFAFEVHGIHNPVRDFLVGAEGAALPEHVVDEGGFAVIDVSDNRNVAQIRINCQSFHGLHS